MDVPTARDLDQQVHPATGGLHPRLGRYSPRAPQNWADIVVGGRVQLAAGKKASIDLLGDVGGWNATAKLDYEFATLLGYKVCPKWTLEAGYRYLFIDYRPGSASVLNVVTSGAVIGAIFHVK